MMEAGSVLVMVRCHWDSALVFIDHLIAEMYELYQLLRYYLQDKSVTGSRPNKPTFHYVKTRPTVKQQLH